MHTESAPSSGLCVGPTVCPSVTAGVIRGCMPRLLPTPHPPIPRTPQASLALPGESFSELRARALRDRELRLRRVLERLRDKRRLMRKERVRREFPVVSVVGYTNCGEDRGVLRARWARRCWEAEGAVVSPAPLGKTTLIRALTGEAALQPRDQPFATLDVTVHEGRLPSRLRVLYVDTIGFLSQLPHSLIHAFSATLEDVAYSVRVSPVVRA